MEESSRLIGSLAVLRGGGSLCTASLGENNTMLIKTATCP